MKENEADVSSISPFKAVNPTGYHLNWRTLPQEIV